MPMDERPVSFGPFRLLPAQRLLLEGDKPVRLGSRACDILTTLVERPGQLLRKPPRWPASGPIPTSRKAI